MAVTWVTATAPSMPPTSSQVVKWGMRSAQGMQGMQSGAYPFSAFANTTTYTKEQMCDAPANGPGWRSPGFIHTAVMTNLSPGIRYFYIVGADNSDTGTGAGANAPDSTNVSIESSFVLPDMNYFNLLIFGDLGQGNVDDSLQTHRTDQSSVNMTTTLLKELDSANVSDSLAAPTQQISAALIIGDLSYANGHLTKWENFFDQIYPIASQIPWMSCPGNHEKDLLQTFNSDDSGGECGIPYTMRMRMPQPSPQEMWWSINRGPVHILSISTEHDLRTGSPNAPGSSQYSFILNDLINVNRSQTPWLIVVGHRPMYGTAILSDESVATTIRSALEPLFAQYQVDAAFWGHHHCYQRTCPIMSGICNRNPNQTNWATLHIVTGASSIFADDDDRRLASYFDYVDFDHHGYTRVTINATMMRFQYVTVPNRIVLDDVIVTKKSFP